MLGNQDLMNLYGKCVRQFLQSLDTRILSAPFDTAWHRRRERIISARRNVQAKHLAGRFMRDKLSARQLKSFWLQASALPLQSLTPSSSGKTPASGRARTRECG